MRIEYINVKSTQLHDELIINGINPLLVESLENKTWITFDNNTDFVLVQKIISEHIPVETEVVPTEIELLQEENIKLKTRLYETEIATAETSSMQEELIMLLIEMGVI